MEHEIKIAIEVAIQYVMRGDAGHIPVREALRGVGSAFKDFMKARRVGAPVTEDDLHKMVMVLAGGLKMADRALEAQR